MNHRTTKGIGVWSTSDEIEKAYGKPTATIRFMLNVINTREQLVFDSIGLGFSVYVEGSDVGHVEAVFVFRPGTAKSIWNHP